MSDISKDLAALRIPQEDRAGRGKPIVVTVVILLLLGGGGFGAWYWSTALQAATVKVVPVSVKAGGPNAPSSVLNASGYVVARRRATASSKVTGKVLDVLIEEGHPVKQGQIVAHLDDTQARASLNLSEAQLAAARKGYAEDEAKLAQAEVTLKRREALLKEQGV